MSLNIKKAGAYSAAAGVFVKKSGVYSAVQGVFAKVAGVYQNVMAAVFSLLAIGGGNYIRRNSGLTGVSNNSSGSVSFWFAPDYTAAVDNFVFVLSSGRAWVATLPSGQLRIVLTDGVRYFIFATVSTFNRGVEAHYAFSWNTNFAAGSKQGQLYKNGVPDYTVIADTDIAFTPILIAQPAVMASPAGASPSGGTMREIMYWAGTKIDWSTNIGKVYSASGPVDVGATGNLVTGSVPTVYLSLRGFSPASTILTNRGTGGDFVAPLGPPTRADTALIGYGDSLLYGTGATIIPTDTWFYKVSSALSTPRRSINMGVGGLPIGGSPGIADNMTNASNIYGYPTAAGNVALYRDRIWILEGGYNSIANGVSNIVTNAQAMVAALLAADPSAKWIFIGIPNGNINSDGISGGSRYITLTTANSQMATAFGANFLDILPYLIANGLSINSLTATGNDLADIADGIVPRQIRMADTSVHWNNFGHIAVTQAVLAKMTALGYN